MNLSRKEILEYKTTSDALRKNAIEMKVLDDPFDRDALDGWSNKLVTATQLKKLDRKIKLKHEYKIYFFSAIIVLFTILSIFVLINSQKSLEKKSITKGKIINTIQTIISKDSIKSFQQLPEKLQIKPNKIKTDFEKRVLLKTHETNLPIEISQEHPHLPLKNLEKINYSLSKRENIGKETYLNDLKIIDYRNYRSKPNESVKNELGGTPANMEMNNNETNNAETNIEYTYFSFLDKTLKYFDKNKFKIALNRFEIILGTYPDDANALFYSAICLYNLNRFDLCENRLLQLQNSRFTNFDQEQQWYLLLVYKSLGKKNSFDLLKEEIINENGFYSKAAKVLAFN